MFIPRAYQIWKILKAISNQRVSSKYRVEDGSIKSNDNFVWYKTKCDSFILFFIQFACINLDGSQKEEHNILNLLQKEGGPRKGGVSSEKGGGGGPNPGGNCDFFTEFWKSNVSTLYHSP